uniref:DELTA-alicitoxin-Pse2b n=1 Tax=Phyllodiscus semoni TaxID=163701 RepID=TX60B_PHYSE|nr:RecName: Full=DELTA-alicitoxin-Pse2b; Short=DELTA-ALTX-Pse2b; AltName: Full=Toxin PsTX-60B; Short=PTX60B; Flags: Precursor [Phyllodiscus semoni]BAF46273.1 sea anemone toxin PsTX-60B [Phyllodiscus semoni]
MSKPIIFLLTAFVVLTDLGATEDTEKVEVKAKPSKTSRGAIGQGFELHKIDLLSKELQGTGAQVFEELPVEECTTDNKLGTIQKDDTFYSNTESLYNSVASNSKIEPSLKGPFTLGTSVGAVTNNIVSEKSEIQGLSLNLKAYSMIHALKQDCINKKPLAKDLVSDFEALDREVKKPWLKPSWRKYKVFLEKFGTHIVRETMSGSSIYQYVFAKSSESFKQRDFKIKACLSLGGPTQVGKLGISACSDVSKKDVEESSGKEMVKKLVVRGGKSDTRVDLTGELSKNQINKFLKEATTDPSPIQYTFYPVWTILKARYIGKEHYAKATNLEQFYKGYLNFDCAYEKSEKGLELQKFELAEDSDPDAPTYVCKLGPEGCHSDDDCESDDLIYCACCGDSCIRYNNTVLLSTGDTKKVAFINDVDDEFRDHGCGRKGLKCKCKEENKKWGQSWSGDSDADAALRDINAMMLDQNRRDQAKRHHVKKGKSLH